MPTRRHDAEQPPGDPVVAARIERAALEASAELGYQRLTVEAIIGRAAVSRATFYRLYDDRAGCFAKAYAKEADSLVARLLAGCRSAAGWRQGIDRVLAELAGFAEAAPLLANGIVVQARLAETPVTEKRAEALRTLADAMDAARRESDFSPPRIAAPFVIGAIESALVDALLKSAPVEFADAFPSLRYIAVATFFGPEVARAEMKPGS
ncbi:MAG: TetR/AcrR family transcriptional regulator [Solirubrobacterales bacterium]